MRDLNFRIDRQTLSKDGDMSGLVRGTTGYLRCVFSFDPSWDGYQKIASFVAKGVDEAVAIEDGMAMVPDEIAKAGRIELRVLGVKGKEIVKTSTVELRQGG